MQDNLIREGVALYAKEGFPNWKAVAEHAGSTYQQVSNRWHQHLCPRFESRKKGPWTEEEV